MRILLTNDDGIGAPGLHALVGTLAAEHEVYVAAPAAEQSGMAHALTVHRDIEVCTCQAFGDKVVKAWSIDGTPTDCVKICMEALEQREIWPELVISGINKGANLGTDVLYSGTVGGAMEGYMHGIPAIALSLDAHSSLPFGEAAAQFAEKLPWIFEQAGRDFFLNVNFPKTLRNGEAKFVWASLGHRDYINAFDRIERDGRLYYHIGGEMYDWGNDEDTDIRRTEAGFIAVTPLTVDMTDVAALKKRGIAPRFSGRLAEQKKIS
ncbi:MAG: 5'/3'-nucleotidase SurE [Schwartzia sp.]|nr:5'/3'-nucleotidase SurE [Schwartzia sp. (in: firmicutes)]